MLGYIIEKISKATYSQVLQARIFTRLHLKNTYGAAGDSFAANEAWSYEYGENAWHEIPKTNASLHGGAGCLVSTPTDLIKFIEAIFSGKLVKPSSLEKMKTMIDDYGMGMFPDKYGSQPSFGHDGRLEEFYSSLWYFPKEKLTLAYCTNGMNYPRKDLLEGILKICFNEPFAMPFDPQTDSTIPDPREYAGTYASDQIKVTCNVADSMLSVETKGKIFSTERIGTGFYTNVESGYYFEFSADKKQLRIKEKDNSYLLKKVE